MNLTQKSTNESESVENDLSIHQKENLKIKSKKSRRIKRKITSEYSMDDQQDGNTARNDNSPENSIFDTVNSNFSSHYGFNDNMSHSNEHSIDNILNKREKIMNSLQKEQFQIANPDLRPFRNAEHACEALLPYHIYSKPSYDDYLYKFSLPNDKLYNELDNIVESVNNTLMNVQELNEHNSVIDLLLTEEQRFLMTKYSEYLRNKKKRIRRPVAQRKTITTKQRRQNQLIVKIRLKEVKLTNTKVILRLNLLEN